MQSISRHQLLIDSGYTHTHIHILTIRTGSILRNWACGWHTPGLKIVRLQMKDICSYKLTNPCNAIIEQRIPHNFCSKQNYWFTAKSCCSCANQIKMPILLLHQREIETYLGRDLKVLAMACGIDAANCEYSCVWSKWPRIQS